MAHTLTRAALFIIYPGPSVQSDMPLWARREGGQPGSTNRRTVLLSTVVNDEMLPACQP
jgi:hypothetical protein